MPETSPDARAAGVAEVSRFGGAAADFVGGLGRKVVELGAALDAFANTPERERYRDELRRKLHALGVGARLLHFDVLARAIAEATRRIDEEATAGVATEQLVKLHEELTTLLRRIPDLAWAKSYTTPTPPPAQEAEPLPLAPPPTTPWTALVIGPEPLALALESNPTSFSCEVERTDDVQTALELARAVAPEVIVVDVDCAGAYALIEVLLEDPLTATVPIVAHGRFADAKASDRLIALGVAKTIGAPSAPSTIREACAEVVGETARRAWARTTRDLGELSVTELADRLADEVRRVLVGEATAAARGIKVPLGVGAEVLGPMWGALARVRDIVRARSNGAVSFREEQTQRPIAVASALSLEEVDGMERRAAARSRLEVDLAGRTVVVADDDPAVVWFVGDVLRAAGATVLEARDGGEALDLVRRSAADVVISDVLMPRVDGLTLARTLRHDVALRDRPVILLSWKEDLLKRLRDLRMESHAMIVKPHKEADGRTIVARVREVLVPRLRVEARIAGGGEVRGRLDDLTVTSLLEMVYRLRREASVVVRDAANVFDVELEGGGVRHLSRTGVDGSFARGAHVLPSLLGVFGGRFLVRGLASRHGFDAIPGELEAQLAPVLRRIRAACEAVSGAHTVELVELELEPELLGSYLAATPPPMRLLLERIASGSSPRAMILAGEVAPSTLEDILLDVASRGIVLRALGEDGSDLLASAPASSAPPSPIAHAPTVSGWPRGKSSRRMPSEPAHALADFSLESVAPPSPQPRAEPRDELARPRVGPQGREAAAADNTMPPPARRSADSLLGDSPDSADGDSGDRRTADGESGSTPATPPAKQSARPRARTREDAGPRPALDADPAPHAVVDDGPAPRAAQPRDQGRPDEGATSAAQVTTRPSVEWGWSFWWIALAIVGIAAVGAWYLSGEQPPPAPPSAAPSATAQP